MTDADKIKEPSKVCVGCNIDKPYSEYHSKTTRSGNRSVQSKCKPCMSEYKKKRYWGNREIELSKMTKSRLKPENVLQRQGYYERNKDEYKERYLKYMKDEEKKKRKREVSRAYEVKAAEKIRERKKIYGKRPDVVERKRATHHRRKKEDAQYSIKRRLRFRLRHEIKRVGEKKFNKTYHTFDLVGCDFETLKKHIESNFKDGMCWERLSEIHIDHIKPCVKFDLTNPDEQKKCFHYTNLQPLWKHDNLKKHDKYIEEYV